VEVTAKPDRRVLRIAAAACLAALALHAYSIVCPMIVYDDFQIVAKSLTWGDAWANLWLPANEHAMPLGRLSTGLLTHLAGRQTWLPAVIAWQGPLALLAAMGLLYLFVRRELGHPLYGLVAMILFGVTSVYHQAVSWFAASFSVPTLVTLLLALLAAQSWRRTGRPVFLGLCTLAAGLAPGWFASGVLAGPLCCLYLVPLPEGSPESPGSKAEAGFVSRLLPLALCLLPLLGTAAFLAISLPRTAEHIMHLPHYGEKTALEALHPLTGLVYTGRSIVDNLTLGVFGISGVQCPLVLVPVVLVGLGVLVGWWWRPIHRRRFLILGLGLILLNYGLVYSARAEWGYENNMNGTAWGRYHLLPQMGLALLFTGGLPRYAGRLFQLDPAGGLTQRQVRTLGILIVVLLVTQLPRDIFATVRYQPQQKEVLRVIEATDARCRAEHISADTARAALDPLPVPCCGEDENGWELLRGSADPRPVGVAEARRLLTRPDP
jgi:hypothetical protein